MITPYRRAGATISTVKIRAVTLGLDLPRPEVTDAPFFTAGAFLREARDAFQAGGIEVETTRLAGGHVAAATPTWTSATEAAARAHGIEYLSIGRFAASAHAFVGNELGKIL